MFKIEIKQNGEYENKTPNFKAMDLGEEVVVLVKELLKEGTASKGDRTWTWYLFKMVINGEEVAGFAPTSKVSEAFLDNIGNEVIVKKVTYRDNKDNEKIGFEVQTSSTSFEFKESDLKDKDGVYTDKQAVGLLKKQGDYDNLEQYKKMWVKYGSTEERAEQVFNNKSRVR